MKPSILLVYTGGTIGMIQDAESGFLKPFRLESILEQIPQLKKIDAVINTVGVEKPKDSANMHSVDWQEIGQLIFSNYNNYSGFVVLHGTDTMAYTTSALSFMFKNLNKPIIFTGSQLPIGHVRTDAMENVLTAIEMVLLEKDEHPLINEVCLYFGNKLYKGNCVTKISSRAFDAFESPNIEPLIVSNLNLEINYSLLRRNNQKELAYFSNINSSVFVYKIHPGITQDQFEQISEFINFKVLILETYGSGTIFNDSWLADILKKIIDRGVIVINVSQCLYGDISDIYEISEMLNQLGVVNTGTMTLEAAIAKSMHLMGLGITNDEFKALYIENIAGELS